MGHEMITLPSGGVARRRMGGATVLAGVRALPRRQREVVVLGYWLDLSEREIADALGLDESMAPAP